MKNIILVIMVVISTNCAFPQYIVIHKNVESSQHFKINEIDSITFCPETVSYLSKVYNVVVIEDRCWLKENLDVGTRINGTQNPSNNEVIEKYCNEDDPNNCDTYGGLYQWNEAMQYIVTAGTQGICPPGWHIPTLAEFQTLISAVNNESNPLKEIGQGSGAGAGTNTSGFSALLGGHRNATGTFSAIGGNTVFWSSTELDASHSYRIWLASYNNTIGLSNDVKNFGYSIRCIMD